MHITPERLEKELRQIASSLYHAKQTFLGDKVDALANRCHEARPECGKNGADCVICSDRLFRENPIKTAYMTPDEQREYTRKRRQD
jgi:hypothetical protein